MATIQAALAHLGARGLPLVRLSRWYRSPAWPPSDQPDYVNAVAALATDLPPDRVLAELLAAEAAFGRRRTVRNAARPLDLDLLACGATVRTSPDGRLELPHPRLAQRAFVLLPLRDVAPGWLHPVTGRSVAALLADLDARAVRPFTP